MLAAVFSDPGRLLQEISNGTTSTGSEDGSSLAAGLAFGTVQILAVLCWCFGAYRCILDERRGRENAMVRVTVMAAPSSELPHHSERSHKIPKCTLAKRKQAILELFEKVQVTMVSIDHAVMARHHNKQFTQMRELTVS
jgi:hypothetical protein